MNRPPLTVTLLVLAAGCQGTGPRFDAHQAAAHPPAAPASFVAVSPADNFNPNWLRPPTNYFTLGPGDRLEIDRIGHQSVLSTNALTLVAPDGKIYYSMLPGLEVWGLTLKQTKALLEKDLRSYFRDPPRLTLTLREVASKRVWLLGRLNRPGVYPLTGPTTLLEAISEAGGPASLAASPIAAAGPIVVGLSTTAEDQADLHHSFLIRKGRILPVDFYRLLHDGDMRQNIYLQPDDFVYLAAAVSDEYYVLGAVRDPRILRSRKPMTLVRAIASAGGCVENAYPSHVAIVRGSLTRPQIAIVDFRAITRGRQTDVPLQSRDIVYVPRSPYRVLSRYVYLVVNTFASTVGVNEGARAVYHRAAPVGTFVPLTLGVPQAR
jgi:polysaccharide biosynthesis/export protein